MILSVNSTKTDERSEQNDERRVYELYQSCIEIEGESVEVYGLTLTDFCGGKLQQVTISDITSDKNKMLDFISLLTQHQASAINICDIVEDFIAQ